MSYSNDIIFRRAIALIHGLNAGAANRILISLGMAPVSAVMDGKLGGAAATTPFNNPSKLSYGDEKMLATYVNIAHRQLTFKADGGGGDRAIHVTEGIVPPNKQRPPEDPWSDMPDCEDLWDLSHATRGVVAPRVAKSAAAAQPHVSGGDEWTTARHRVREEWAIARRTQAKWEKTRQAQQEHGAW